MTDEIDLPVAVSPVFANKGVVGASILRAAIFPIPDCVVFPGTVFPLHVFEPRYRAMVHHCLDNDFPLAIAHTQKVVSECKKNQTIEEVLQSNQSTYKPQQIFSAGYCKLIDTLPDGRMRVDVHICHRLEFIDEVQTLPFSIAQCRELHDDEVMQIKETKVLAEKVLHRLTTMTADHAELNQLLTSDEWLKKTPCEVSFEVFAVIRFEPALLQKILESTSVAERLTAVLTVLNS